MSNILDVLPAEILYEVLKASPDLSTLWALMNTCRIFSSLFRARSIEVVDGILITTVPVEIQSYMRAILHIRIGSFEYKTFGEAHSLPLASLRPLDSSISPLVLWKFVGLAHKVHMLAHSCLDRCISKCASVQSVSDDHDLTKGFEPPSWTEEHRALLAFWRVQYFMELKAGALRARLDWDAEDLEKMEKATIQNFFFIGCAAEQMLTAWDFIGQLEGARSPPLALPGVPEGSDFGWVCEPHPAPKEFHQDQQSMEQRYFQENEDSDSSSTSDDGLLTTFDFPATFDAFPHVCGNYIRLLISRVRPLLRFGKEPPLKEWKNMSRETLGWLFHQSTAHDSKARLLDDVKYFPRRFGFVMWDERRMIDLGYWSRDALKDGTLFYEKWYGILTAEDIATGSMEEDGVDS